MKKFHNTKNIYSPDRSEYFLVRRMSIALLASIIVGELCINVLIKNILFQELWIAALFDSLLLVIIIYPAVYYSVLRPFALQLSRRAIAESELKKSLSLIEAVFESIHNGILVVGTDGSILRSNRQFAAMWNIPDEILSTGNIEMIRKTKLAQLIDPDKFIETVTAMYQNPHATTNDLVFLLDGRIFERISKPVYLEDEIIGRVWSFHDITGIKRAQDALQEEKQFIRTLIDNIPDSIYTKDLSCKKTLANKTELRYLGARYESEILGIDDFDIYPRELAEKFYADDQLVIKTGNPILNREEFIFDNDHNKRWLLSSKLPMRDNNNRITGIIGIGRDITDRKHAEEALTESEAHYRDLLLKLPDGVYKSTHDGKILEANPAMVSLLGYESVEELAAVDILSQLYFDPAERDVNYSKDTPVHIEIYRMRKRDGSEIWVEDHGWYNFDDNGVIVYHEGVIRDITERKKSEEKIYLMNLELIKTVSEKDKFFSIISHDLRSPFNSFLGLTRVMLEQLPGLKMEELQMMAENMHNSATNLFRLLENLLQWSQVQQGTIPNHPKPVKLLPLVKDCLSLVSEHAQNKQIVIEFTIPEFTEVFADRNLIQSIIGNLLSNSLKFTPKKGKVQIKSTGDNDKNIIVSVADTGIGMDEAMLNNLFILDGDIGRRGTDNEPSTGIGLILCKEFVLKLGGELWVESVVDQGTIFYFSVPNSHHIGYLAENQIGINDKSKSGKSEKLKILIAEDDNASEFLLTAIVKSLSSSILKVRTGVDAIEVCRNNPDIDLILMDIRMPGIDGFEASRQIRSFNKEVFIIAQSAYFYEDGLKLALDAGCNEYISKPINISVLNAIIEDHFNL